MKKWIIILSVLLFAGIIGGYLGYRFVYNKPHIDFVKAEADFSFEAEQLFKLYTNNRGEAEQQYNGKVLAVQGRVSSVETVDSLTIVVFAMAEGMFGDEGIRLSMLESYAEAANALAVGDPVTIKGFCTGFNDTDIILEKCSIINK